MKEPFLNEYEAMSAFMEWRELFTKGKNEGLSPEERRRIRVLSKRLGQWFKPD